MYGFVFDALKIHALAALSCRSSYSFLQCPQIRYFAINHYKVITFLLWLILFVLCAPLAILALVLYPVIWLLLLPFRILGIAVDSVLSLVKAVFLLPSRLIKRIWYQRRYVQFREEIMLKALLFLLFQFPYLCRLSAIMAAVKICIIFDRYNW